MMDGKFCTDHLPLASFIHCTKRLPFLGCEPERDGGRHVIFIFSDSHGEANKIITEFESGAQCSAADFYDSLRRLRKLIDMALGRNGGGR